MEGVCKIGASVPTGLEVGAAEECTEALGRPVEPTRGRLGFTLGALEELEKVSEVCIKWSVSAQVKKNDWYLVYWTVSKNYCWVGRVRHILFPGQHAQTRDMSLARPLIFYQSGWFLLIWH